MIYCDLCITSKGVHVPFDLPYDLHPRTPYFYLVISNQKSTFGILALNHYTTMQELTFTIQPEEDGGYVAKSKLEKGSIITQGDDIKELKAMILDAIEGYFWDKPNEKPKTVLLKFEEVLALA